MKNCRKCETTLNEKNSYSLRIRMHDFICKKCCIIQSQIWKRKNPEKVKIQRKRYRKKHPQQQYHHRLFLIKQAQFTCKHCGIKNENPSFFDIDHVVPRKGGTKHINPARFSNLQVLCPNCHRLKTINDKQT